MIWHSYRSAYDRLKAELAEAREGEWIERHERAAAALDAFVASIATDARKLRAIARDCPETAEEIRARAAEMGLPRTVLDPLHDPSFARLWLATLEEAQMRMLERCLADEMLRRRRDPAAAHAAAH